jgi:hypothetical protein
MTGGLVQIVTSGKQDIYLTIKPEITFFKKVFRRYTNFSLELIEIAPEQASEFNNTVSFNINNGDAIHRCYLEIDLPLLSFSDEYITHDNYIKQKSTQLSNLTTQINIWKDYYNNLKGFVDIELQLYKNLYNLLQSINISINSLKAEVSKFNFKNKQNKNQYKNSIENDLFQLIDISGYIGSITKLVTNADEYNTNQYISVSEITSQLNQMYQIMTENLQYYNNKIIQYSKQITEITKKNQINFNYAKYLGHQFFENISFDIGGVQIDKYSNDVFHINQMHHIEQNYMQNYLEMIGHVPKLYTFNNEPKGNTKIIVPLMFWFNKDAGACLPLVSLQYANVMLNAKINDVKKLVCWEDYETMYDQIVKMSIENTNGYVLNLQLIYKKFQYTIDNKSIQYDCDYVSWELLAIKYSELNDEELQIILTSNGTGYTIEQFIQKFSNTYSYLNIDSLQKINDMIYIIDKYQWVRFMIDIKNNIYSPPVSNIAEIVGSYYPYVNFNLYYSLINNPSVKLIGEVVFLDDVERAKFAGSKLEYIVETFKEDVFNMKNQNFYDCELSFINPCKELLWYVQPQIFQDGLTENGQNTCLVFDTNMYFQSNPIQIQKLTFNHLDILQQNVDMNYYTYLLSYKYLNNILPNGVYYNSFSLYPEETQPSGATNLKQIKGKEYRVEFNSEFTNEYLTFLNKLYTNQTLINNKKSIMVKFISKSYDLFVVHKGTAKLLFST